MIPENFTKIIFITTAMIYNKKSFVKKERGI